MTVLSQSNKMAPQAMNGVATNFAFSYRALITFPGAIKAIVTDTLGVNPDIDLLYNDGGSDGYTVAIDADGVGGSITVNDARTATDEITIYREYDETQESNYENYNSFPSETAENNYDKLTMIDQQQTEILERALVLPITVTGVDTTLPIPEAGRPIGWNDTATGLTNYPDLVYQLQVDVDATPDYLGASAGVGVLRCGSSISKTDGGDFVTLAVVPGSVDHDALLNYVADQHIAHSGVDIVAGAGLTGGGVITVSRTVNIGAGTGITVNADDIEVSADYSVITANDAATDVTAVELETLTDGSNADGLHTHATITDDQVKIDAAATRGYIGATNADGVIRSGALMTYVDGGDFVTLNVDEAALTHDNLIAGTIASHDTTATGANLTTLTDGSNTTLHAHTDITGNAATVTTNANLTGDVTSVGNATTVVTNANLTGIVTSVGNATAIADKAIAIAKLADGTDGELITWDAAGVITTVAAGTSGQILTSNGPGAAPTFQTSTGLLDPMTTRGDIIIRNASNVTARLPIGTNTQVLTSDGTDISWQPPSGGGGAGVSFDVTQASHGFSVGDWLYLNGTTYTLAQADTVATAEAVGVVSVVLGVNSFTLQMGGRITGLSGLTAGTVYFLSDSVAGEITATQPTGESDVSKPVLVADTTTTGYIFNWRGVEIVATAGGGYGESFVDGDLTAGVLTVTHNIGHKICTVVVSDNSDNIIIPDEVNFVNTTSLTVDLSSFGTLTGTWNVFVVGQGAGTAIPDPTLQEVFDAGQSITIADGDNQTLSITNSDTTNNPRTIYIQNDGSADGIYLTQLGVLATGRNGLEVVSSAAQVNSNLVHFRLSSGSSTQNVVNIVNSGTGASLDIDQIGNGPHIRFTGDPTVASPVDGDFWFDGTDLKFRNGTTTQILGSGTQTYTGNLTRDMTAANGSVGYTGIGFEPKAVIFFGTINNLNPNTSTWGFGTAAGNRAMYNNNPATGQLEVTTLCIHIGTSSTDKQRATISSMDSDGFTLAWTKGGSPTGTGTVQFLAIG